MNRQNTLHIKRIKKECIIPTCESHKSILKYISIHRFPHDKAQKEKWIANIKTKDWAPKITGRSRICSEHFKKNCIKKLGEKHFLTLNAEPYPNDNHDNDGTSIVDPFTYEYDDDAKSDIHNNDDVHFAKNTTLSSPSTSIFQSNISESSYHAASTLSLTSLTEKNEKTIEEKEENRFVTAFKEILRGNKSEIDQYDALGNYIAHKMRFLQNEHQKIFVEALVMQAFQKAALNKLTEDSTIVEQPKHMYK